MAREEKEGIVENVGTAHIHRCIFRINAGIQFPVAEFGQIFQRIHHRIPVATPAVLQQSQLKVVLSKKPGAKEEGKN